jgi:hypothetical protein
MQTIVARIMRRRDLEVVVEDILCDYADQVWVDEQGDGERWLMAASLVCLLVDVALAKNTLDHRLPIDIRYGCGNDRQIYTFV